MNQSIGYSQAPWRVVLGSWLLAYLSQNIFLLMGLNAPDPLSRLYKRSFYRATWILTALDAGFFTAMRFKPLWLRHMLSIVFSLYYLVFADAAEDKVRKIRSTISVEQMRISWEKVAHNPILKFISRLTRPRLTIEDILTISRTAHRANKPPIKVHRYYAAAKDTFKDHNTVLLQFPGGGFVSMPPPCHEDSLSIWAHQTGLPVFSVNYKKAPEYPYPWPIEECFDLYVAIIQSKGKVLGLSGGNITAAVTLKIISHNQHLSLSPTSTDSSNNMIPHLPPPLGLILIYPALDFEMSCWMSPSSLSLIRAESSSNLFRSGSLQSLWLTKDHLSHVSPLSVVPDAQDNDSGGRWWSKRNPTIHDRAGKRDEVNSQEAWASSRLAMTSRMSFFNDRIITPDLMRAMAILYLGPHASPDFDHDYLLSPIKAPEELLAQFPKTFMICGEKDPLVDDTVIFAGRIRQAKMRYNAEEDVRVQFLEGISHAFLQMMAFLPEAHEAAGAISDWIKNLCSQGKPPLVNANFRMTSEKDMLHRRKQQLVTGLF
ncbi:MAG: Alpha/Beta hydrolase protein [Benjaminiella poitrasii]|nr:MAG: Alpha/Beta hydrolase protein [Benjaminiella poitrasii]